MQRTILCYGDSNTWGYIPTLLNSKNVTIKRYSRSERWPGVLQNFLGEGHYVVEEGLNGRTTNLDYAISPNRNGKVYLSPCLYTHVPIDLVVLVLGDNDLKIYFNRSAAEIRDGLAELVDIIQASKYGPNLQKAPEILIVTTPVPLSVAGQFIDENGIVVFAGAVKKAKRLIDLFAALSKEKHCHFLDISRAVSLSELDGLHLDAIAYKKVAQMVGEKIS